MALRRASICVVVLASSPGCRQLFGIDDTAVLDGGTAGDRDDDGVPDDGDNCPDDANSEQADEDGDELGDVCDPCPPFDANDDTDGDGLGSGCDPDPSRNGDALVAFEGFARPLSPAWSVIGPITLGNGDAIADAPETVSAVLAMPAPGAPRTTIRAAVTLERINVMVVDVLGAIGLADSLQAGTAQGIVCQLSGLPSGLQEELRIFDSAASAVVNNAPHPLDPNLRVELTLTRDGISYGCRATSPVLEIEGDATFAPIAPSVGIRVHAATARFHWLLVTRSP